MTPRLRLTALGFVTLYGAGFVGAKLGLPHAGPFAFLALRFALAAVLLAGLALLCQVPWPTRRALPDIAAAGLLTAGVFSGGVFVGLAGGVAPAESALVIAIHPLLTATLAPRLLGERIDRRQWLGLALGLLGVGLVLQRGLLGATPGWALVATAVGLAGLTAGNFYQKARCAAMHPLAGGAVQCAACAVACALAWLAVERTPVRWQGEFVVALLWMAVVVSVGAVSLLVVLIRHGAVSQVAGLFYLVPVSAAVTAWWLFGDRPTGWQWLGAAVAGAGVVLATRPAPTGPARAG